MFQYFFGMIVRADFIALERGAYPDASGAKLIKNPEL